MATKAAGRKLLVKKNAVVIAGVRETEYGVDIEGIDVTDNDSGLWEEYLPGEESKKSWKMSVKGVAKDEALRAAGFSTVAGGCMLTDITITDPTQGASGDVVSGNVLLTSYKATGGYRGAIEFEATMIGSGAPTLA